METLNISVPDKMGQWIYAQIETGKYSSANDYLYRLIINDQHSNEIRSALIAGEKSGISKRNVKEIIAANKARLQKLNS